MLVAMRRIGPALVVCSLAFVGCNQAGPDSPHSDDDAGDLATRMDGAASATNDAARPFGDLGPDMIAPDMLPPPEKIALCPQDQETDIGTNSVVRVHAVTPIDTRTVSDASLMVRGDGTLVAGAVTVDEADLIFTPAAPFPAGATLEVTLDGGVRDRRGVALARGGETWTFTTGAGDKPTV